MIVHTTITTTGLFLNEPAHIVVHDYVGLVDDVCLMVYTVRTMLIRCTLDEESRMQARRKLYGSEVICRRGGEI